MAHTDYIFTIHRVPIGVALGSSNEKDYRVMEGVPGTRLQAATEGVASAIALAGCRPLGVNPADWPAGYTLTRKDRRDMAKELADYQSDGFVFGGPEGVYQYYLGIELTN